MAQETPSTASGKSAELALQEERARLQIAAAQVERNSNSEKSLGEGQDEIEENFKQAEVLLEKIDQNFIAMGNNPTQDQLDANADDLKKLDTVLDRNDVLLQVQTQTLEQQKETDARLVREAAEQNNDLSVGNPEVIALIRAFLESLTSGKDMSQILQDMAKEMNNALEAQKQEQGTPQSDVEQPQQKVSQNEVPEAQKPHEAAPSQDTPKGYVNEGEGPLVTAVNKPEDAPVSPLIATAFTAPENSNQNILGSIFMDNSTAQIGDDNVIVVPFAPQPAEVSNTTPDVDLNIANDEVTTQVATGPKI